MSAPAAPEATMSEASEPVSPVLSLFQAYSAELDEHYDRRERIIKTSRDITALSKKLIFHLHRVTQRNPKAVLREAQPKLKELADRFDSLQEDLAGERYWRYQRQVSPGVQEYVCPVECRFDNRAEYPTPDRSGHLYALPIVDLRAHDHRRIAERCKSAYHSARLLARRGRPDRRSHEVSLVR